MKCTPYGSYGKAVFKNAKDFYFILKSKLGWGGQPL